MPDVSPLDTPGVSLALRGALHLGGSVRVHSPDVAMVGLGLQGPGECVRHVVIVLLLTLALHEQARALDELVHGHDEAGALQSAQEHLLQSAEVTADTALGSLLSSPSVTMSQYVTASPGADTHTCGH